MSLIDKVKALFVNQQRIYVLAFLLSLLSTLFGLLREFLIIAYLGFSDANDYLQIYLSLYFSLCLLGDPFRLSYLNLISNRSFKQILILSAFLSACVSITLLIMMYYANPQLDISLLCIAALSGILATLVALSVCHKQRFDAYIPSQLVNIMPNLILVPAVILIHYLPTTLYVFYFLMAFAVLHLIQLACLYCVKTTPDLTSKQKMRLDDVFVFMRHLMSIFGEQFFQIASRILFLTLGEGAVTLLSLFMKIFLTARYIIVDSYIGPKLKEWHFSEHQDMVHALLKKHYSHLGGACLLSFFLMTSMSNFLSFEAHLLITYAVYFYFSGLYRIAYFKINCFYHFKHLVFFIGIFELFFSVILYLVLNFYYPAYAFAYVVLWCLARMPIELIVLDRYYLKAQKLYVYSTESEGFL